MNIILTLLLSLPIQSRSFSPAARLPLATNGAPSIFIRPAAVISSSSSRLSPSSSLMAKPRRRRKPDSPTPITQSDDLPDFDDGEDESVEEEPIETSSPSVVTPSSPVKVKTTPTTIKRGAGLNAQLAEEVGGNVDGLDEDVILEAMRGKAGGDKWQPPRSIQDTLSDRGLEKFMNFDRMIEQDGGGKGQAAALPDFDEVIARRKRGEAAAAIQEGRVQDAAMLIDTQSMGKKAARNAERKAAARQREEDMEADKSPFEDFFKDFSILKLLENGAWVGIGLLVLWEVYINSPLFDRAAPIIPVVYDKIPPGM